MKSRFYLVIIGLFIASFSYSQQFLEGEDLSKFNTDDYSNADLIGISRDLKAQQMTLEQVEPIAIAKGMPAEEFTKLKARMQSIGAVENEVKQDAPENASSKAGIIKIAEKNKIVFGSELFSSKSLSFEPNQNLPTPNNYILGPGDKIELSLFGVQQMSHSATINKNGTLSIPNVGEVLLSGLTFEAAKSKLKSKIATIYRSLGNGTQLSTNVSNYRSIMITIIGALQPGNYRVSAMSTVFNALHLAGGPSEIGSFRKIELIRNNNVIRTIDIYDFLTKGDQSDNVSLEDNDMIRIPAYDIRVVIEGEVKRPGVFELLAGENMTDLISYAQGFTDIAYKNRILVKRKSVSELKITDLNEKNYAAFTLKAGDQISVGKILDRYENRIQIRGAVYRPGEYSLNENEVLTIKDLIDKADGVKENVYLKKASLIRQKEDLTREYISFDLEAVLNGDTTENITLQKEDIIELFFNNELLDTFKVNVSGQVRSPGPYEYVKGMTLYDLLLQADYLTERASPFITIFRTKKDTEYKPNDNEKIKSFEVEVDSNNPKAAEAFLLEPRDQVIVRSIVTYETPQMAEIRGMVLYPGNYAIIEKQETVLSFINRTGGLKKEANTDAIYIIRNGLNIPINWEKINKTPSLPENLFVERYDKIMVPDLKETIIVKGDVMLETEVPFVKGKKLKYYLKNAGNATDKGWLRKAYVVYPNGSASATGSFLGIKNYPKIKPGAKIVIPSKPEREGIDSTEVIGMAGILTSIAGVVIAILRLN